MNQNDEFHAYQRAVLGSERAKHTYRKRLDTIEELARGIEGKRVLDIGCGFGFRTIGMAQKGAKTVRAIDIKEYRIQRARLHAQDRKVKNVEFQVMDAALLGFDDESFDLVLADEMIHHAENLPKVFDEVHRVLKKSGLAVISDHNRSSVLSELVRTVYFGKTKERVYTPKEVSAFFIKANFKDIAWKHIILTMPFSNAPKILLRLNYFLESIVESIPILRTQCGVYVIRGVKN